MKARKEKFKFEKKKRGYVISSINNKVEKVSTQILARKVMEKCRADEVLVPVIALAM